jgi:hypothetical protein
MRNMMSCFREGNSMEELIKRLERVIQTGVPDKNGQHPISAEVVLEVVKAQLGTNLASLGTDCISRQQAIDALRDYLVGKRCPDDGTLTCRLIENEVINKLPPIKPKRGRWIKLDMHRGMADHKCTACEQECYVPTCMGEPMYAFCPNCGAKMEVNNEIN